MNGSENSPRPIADADDHELRIRAWKIHLWAIALTGVELHNGDPWDGRVDLEGYDRWKTTPPE